MAKNGSTSLTVPQAKAELHRRVMMLNEACSDVLRAREMLCGPTATQQTSKIDRECKYPVAITTKEYFDSYDREGIAQRVVSIYPDECWAVDPEPYENERKNLTPFEQSWTNLTLTNNTNPLHYCHRVDIASGIGRYGGILFDVDDGRDLSEPMDGINEFGRAAGRARQESELLYMRSLSEADLDIVDYNTDMKSPRFGHPQTYNIRIMSGEGGPSPKSIDQKVHWSRIVHVADNRLKSSEFFGAPRQKVVWNKIMDAHKILGSSAEMLYKGGFPGISVELDPRVLEAMNIEIDEDSVKEEMQKYMAGLQRYLLLIGMNAKPISPQVVDPMPHLIAQLNTIALSIGCPLRIFMGSEQAQLASGQDVRTWNRRLMRRHRKYLSPMLLRPLIDRFVMVGVLRKPKRDNYQIYWPDVNIPNEDERSQIADRRAASLMKFIMSGGHEMLQPSDFLRFVWGLDREEVQEIMTNITQKKPEIKFTPQDQPAGPADSGVSGKPPSKANPKPRASGGK